LRPRKLSGWGACTLAAAASEAANEKNLHHSGANMPSLDFPEGFGELNLNGEWRIKV